VATLPRLRLSSIRAKPRADPAHFFGLDNLDERLLPHVRRRRGTFVELGAFDGVNQSNTAWLEANRGWRGILVEPIPEAYEQCVRNRPLATVVNCACVADDYSDPTVEMVYSGLMSIVRGARSSEETDEAWVSLGEELQQLSRYTFTVPARTLTAVLDEHRLRCVDLLSLDVEGYEIEVLKGLDLERLSLRYILVEESGRGEVDSYLTARGYRKVAEVARGEFTSDVLYGRPPVSGRRIDFLRRQLARWRYFSSAFFLRQLDRGRSMMRLLMSRFARLLTRPR
jgi:FkbM family methyltransferase